MYIYSGPPPGFIAEICFWAPTEISGDQDISASVIQKIKPTFHERCKHKCKHKSANFHGEISTLMLALVLVLLVLA